MEKCSEYEILPSIAELYLRWDRRVYDLTLLHPTIIKQLILTVFIIFNYDRFLETSRYSRVIFNVYYLSTILFISLSNLAHFAVRFGGFFYVVEGILLTYVAEMYEQKKSVLYAISVYALAFGLINYVVRDRMYDFVTFLSL